MRKKLITGMAAICAIALTVGASAGGVDDKAEQARDPDAALRKAGPPRIGVLCAWGILSVVSEVEKRCPGKADPAFASFLSSHMKRLSQHAEERGGVELLFTEEFRSDFEPIIHNEKELCQRQPVALYHELRDGDRSKLTQDVDRAIAYPGPFEWGSCL